MIVLNKYGMSNINFRLKSIFCILLACYFCSNSTMAKEQASATRQAEQLEKLLKTNLPDTVVKQLRQNWGVEVIAVSPTSAGYMLDFRFRVVDIKKAEPLFNRKINPEIIVEKNNAKLGIPVSSKLGALRQAPKHIINNRIYFMLFSNPGKLVKSGDNITIAIGDFNVEKLKVR